MRQLPAARVVDQEQAGLQAAGQRNGLGLATIDEQCVYLDVSWVDSLHVDLSPRVAHPLPRTLLGGAARNLLPNSFGNRHPAQRRQQPELFDPGKSDRGDCCRRDNRL
jgi:hypothetical protein